MKKLACSILFVFSYCLFAAGCSSAPAVDAAVPPKIQSSFWARFAEDLGDEPRYCVQLVHDVNGDVTEMKVALLESWKFVEIKKSLFYLPTRDFRINGKIASVEVFERDSWGRVYMKANVVPFSDNWWLSLVNEDKEPVWLFVRVPEQAL